MPELCISIALVAIGGMLWDAARRYMQLAHGRMLNADRSQTFERAITQLQTRIEIQEATAVPIIANDVRAVARRQDDIDNALATNEQRFAGLADWQKTCERSIELLQADIDKRDKAITNVAEEVAGLQRQQALALMGIAKTPKHGYAPGGPK